MATSFLKVTDSGITTLATDISTTTETSITVPVSASALFPTTGNFMVDVYNNSDPVVASSYERLLVTNVSGTTWTVTRGRDGTTPQIFSIGHAIRLNILAKHITDSTSAINAAENNIDTNTANINTLQGKTSGLSSGTKLTASADPNITYYGTSRQAIVNGNFTVNQRGYVSGAVLSAGAYGHDRWKAGALGGDYTFTQLANSTTITINTGKSLIQVIEDKNVVGGSYTLSWEGTAQARAGVNSATPSGSYFASPLIITGQTAGTVMSIEFNQGTLGKAILNLGTVALPFQSKSFEEELRSCQRYFEKSYIYSVAVGSNTGAANGILLVPTNSDANNAATTSSVFFQVPKRNNSWTGNFYDDIGNISKIRHGNTSNVALAGGSIFAFKGDTSFTYDFLATTATSNRYFFHWTVDNEL